MSNKFFTVLSIEDNIADFELLQEALNSLEGVSITLKNIQTGEEALKALFNKEDTNFICPDIIILDINLPCMTGIEVLRKIKSSDSTKATPVIILSTSDYEKDIKECYSLSANSYITKTFDIKELFRKVAVISEYWFKTAKLPNNCKDTYFFCTKKNNITSLKIEEKKI